MWATGGSNVITTVLLPRLYWFPKINANSIVVRLIDLYELILPRRLRLLAMTMFSCVSLRAKRSNLVITCENDYIAILKGFVGMRPKLIVVCLYTGSRNFCRNAGRLVERMALLEPLTAAKGQPLSFRRSESRTK